MAQRGGGATRAEAEAATVLGTFEGKDVRRAGVEIPSIAGGLRKAMKIQPRVMKQGERGWIAFEYVVDKIKFYPIDDENPAGDQERIHVFEVEGVAFVSEDLVGAEIAAQREAIRLAEDEAKGVVPLPDTGTVTVGGGSAARKASGAAKKATPAKAAARGKREPAAKKSADETPVS